MTTAAQRLAALEVEVARLRQVVEARPASDSDAKLLRGGAIGPGLNAVDCLARWLIQRSRSC